MRTSLVRFLASRLDAVLACDHPEIHREVMAGLAGGRPVSVAAVARSTGLPLARVARVLDGFPDVQLDDAGDLVAAAGLSLIPTAHRLRFERATTYAWCALDTLMYPIVLERGARVESRCPITESTVRLHVTPEGVGEVEPLSAVVSVVVPQRREAACGNVRGWFCDYVRFLRSAAAGGRWREAHPGARILTVDEASRLARELVRRQYG